MAENVYWIDMPRPRTRDPKPGTCGACVSYRDGCCRNMEATIGAVLPQSRDSTCKSFRDKALSDFTSVCDQTGMSEKLRKE